MQQLLIFILQTENDPMGEINQRGSSNPYS